MAGLLGPFRFEFRAMASPCRLHLYAADGMEAGLVANQVIADVRGIEARYSRYRQDSVLSQINRDAGGAEGVAVDEETAGLLDYAAACHAQSDGLFDITSGVLRKAWDFRSARLPGQRQLDVLLEAVGWEKLVWQRPRLRFTRPGMELDFGGIGKEYAADRAATLCLDGGIRHGLVDFGGDLRAIGPRPDGSPWRVGVQHPRRAQAAMAEIAVYEGAIASSGDYERCIKLDGRRYSHILNPKTGWPVQGLAAVSVVAPYCLVAGSACTIAMLKGEAGPAWLADLGLPHVFADQGGRIVNLLRAV